MRMLGAYVLCFATMLSTLSAVAQSATAVSLYADAKPYKDDPGDTEAEDQGAGWLEA